MTDADSRQIIFRGQNVQFRLDLKALRLMRGDTDVPLTRQQMDLLLYFTRRDNERRLISREELLKAFWKNDKNGDPRVYDSALSTAVRGLRKALGEERGKVEFIQTVHGQGFRFLGVIEREGEAEVHSTAGAEHTDDRKHRSALPHSSATPPVVSEGADPKNFAFTELAVKLSDTWPSFLDWLRRQTKDSKLRSIREDESRERSFYHSGKPGQISYPIEVVSDQNGMLITRRFDVVEEWLHPFITDLDDTAADVAWDTSLFPVKADGGSESRIETETASLRDAEYRVLFARSRVPHQGERPSRGEGDRTSPDNPPAPFTTGADFQWSINLGYGYAFFVNCSGNDNLKAVQYRQVAQMVALPAKELGLDIALPSRSRYSTEAALAIGEELGAQLRLKSTRLDSVFDFVWRVMLLLFAREDDSSAHSPDERTLLEETLTRAARTAGMADVYSAELIHKLAWVALDLSQRKQEQDRFVAWAHAKAVE